MKITSALNLSRPTRRKGREDSQLMDKMVAEILCDIFMPRFPYACSRRCCRGHWSNVCHTIIQQAEGYGMGGERDEANILLILTLRGSQVIGFHFSIFYFKCVWGRLHTLGEADNRCFKVKKCMQCNLTSEHSCCCAALHLAAQQTAGWEAAHQLHRSLPSSFLLEINSFHFNADYIRAYCCNMKSAGIYLWINSRFCWVSILSFQKVHSYNSIEYAQKTNP